MPTHRVVILGLLLAFVLVVLIDQWRKGKLAAMRASAAAQPPEPPPAA